MKFHTLSKRISQSAKPLASTFLKKAIEKKKKIKTQKLKTKKVVIFDLFTSVDREECGEGADFEHSGFIPRRVELFDLPTVDVGVIIPRLGLVVLPFVLLCLLMFQNVTVLLMLHLRIHLLSAVTSYCAEGREGVRVREELRFVLCRGLFGSATCFSVIGCSADSV